MTAAAAPTTAHSSTPSGGLAVIHGEVRLASGRTADYYVDLRRVTLDGAAAPIVGRVMRDSGRRLGVRGGRRSDPRRGPGRDGDAARRRGGR